MGKNDGQNQQGSSSGYELVTTTSRNSGNDGKWAVHLRLFKNGSTEPIIGVVRVFDEDGQGIHKYRVPSTGKLIKLPIISDKTRTVKFVVDSVEEGGKTLYPRVVTTPLVLDMEARKDVLKDVQGYDIVSICSDEPITVAGKSGKYWNVNLTVYLKRKDTVNTAVQAKVKIHDGAPREVDILPGGTDVLLPAARNDRKVVFSVSGVKLGSSSDYIDIDVVTKETLLTGVPYGQIPRRFNPDSMDDPITAFIKGLLG